MGGRPNDADANKAIDALVADFGWEYREAEGSKGHVVGSLYCPEHTRAGCRIPVYGTASNTARTIWQSARKCSHGVAPDRKHW